LTSLEQLELLNNSLVQELAKANWRNGELRKQLDAAGRHNSELMTELAQANGSTTFRRVEDMEQLLRHVARLVDDWAPDA